MCQYIETFHVYTDCHLKDTHNGQPTRFAAFLRDVTNRIRGQQNEDGRAKGEDHSEGGPEHHQIKQKNIWQCPKAIKDLNQKETPEHKRVCPDPKYWEGEDKLGQIQSLGITVHRATCPVCAAIEKVIEENSNQTIIIPVGLISQKFVDKADVRIVAGGTGSKSSKWPKEARHCACQSELPRSGLGYEVLKTFRALELRGISRSCMVRLVRP